MGLFTHGMVSISNVTTDQLEKSFQRQSHIKSGFSRSAHHSQKKYGLRWFKNIGLGLKTPRSAIEGTYIDKKCPFTGNVSIRGRILTGFIKSTKMYRTVVVRREYFHYVKKYRRYEKRHSNIPAHLSPCFRCKIGETVIIGQCRPLSKTVRYNVLRVIGSASTIEQGFEKI